MTDLNELQFFVRVSEAQSFTRAAQRLGVPKSTVSRAMTRLESRLGVRLLHRTTRSVSLTAPGELYLDRCRRVLEEAEQADLHLGAALAHPRGTLRIAAPMAFARGVLGPALGDFLAAYPDLSVHLQILGTELASPGKNIDVVVRPGPLEDSTLLVKPLVEIRLAAYAAPSYLALHPAPTQPDDLRNHLCMLTNCGSEGTPANSALWTLHRGADTREVRVQSRASVPDPTINHQLAVAGAGIAILSQLAARADMESGRLVRLLPEWEPEPVRLFAVYSNRLAASPNVRALLDFLGSRFHPATQTKAAPRLPPKRRK